MPSDAAMMIGIHRMPRHKQLGRTMRPRPPPVTDKLVGLVKHWCSERNLRRLFVCPYEELGDRLASHGFASSAVDLGDPGYDTRFGWGLLNAADAVSLAACPWDVDASGDVGVTDFLTLLAAWGDPGGPADLDGDGVVGGPDLAGLLSAWGSCP